MVLHSHMQTLQQTAERLTVASKGILAADETVPHLTKEFEEIGIHPSDDLRRQWRETLFTTPSIDQYLTGVILFEETIRQKIANGVHVSRYLASRGIMPGIKVDGGLAPFRNSTEEKITKGIDDLSKRLIIYSNLGARFAKWRAAFSISEESPTEECIVANAELLAEYAFLCQENGIVPIVEPEVLMDGSHGVERCYGVTHDVLWIVFDHLQKRGVQLDGILLKPNMVIAGLGAGQQPTPEKIAELTIQCFKKVVPSSVPGIVFLSGGQSEQAACENLNAITLASQGCPWQLSFSYGRALLTSALHAWAGKVENVPASQEAFLHQLQLVALAREGKYSV